MDENLFKSDIPWIILISRWFRYMCIANSIFRIAANQLSIYLLQSKIRAHARLIANYITRARVTFKQQRALSIYTA